MGGDPQPLWHYEHNSLYKDADEINRLTLEPDSPLFNKLCQPKNPSLPFSSLASGTGTALYSASYGAPFCQGSNTLCSSATLLEGRANNPNEPNTIDGCADGTDTAFDYESVKQIVVEAVKAGNELRGGELVNIKATVIAYSKSDQVDFYYTADANNPEWIFITKVAPLVGENVVTVPMTDFPEIRYNLPKCTSSSGCQQVS